MWDFGYEASRFAAGACRLGALDEAGRGPLAGPVVAACVVVPSNINTSKALSRLKGIGDSKKLPACKREEIYANIKQVFFNIGVGICDPATIDRINILQATFLAMKKAINSVKGKPDEIVVDGKFMIPNTSFKQQAVVKGDSRIVSVAAASIVAKVERDRIMMQADSDYPQYGFASHKGYGTAQHISMLKEFGPCPIHRRSFARVTAR